MPSASAKTLIWAVKLQVWKQAFIKELSQREAERAALLASQLTPVEEDTAGSTLPVIVYRELAILSDKTE